MRLAIGGLAVAASLVACGAADRTTAAPVRAEPGVIVAQSSIDRLRVGMRPSQVRRVFGAPQRRARLSESESGRPIRRWVYSGRRIEASFHGGRGNERLEDIATRSPRQRTRSGVGVGSTEAAVRRGVPGVECFDADGPRWCALGGDGLGSRQTIFELRSGRVTEVRIVVTRP